MSLKEIEDDGEEYCNLFALCLSCWHRWIATVESRTSVFKLECPKCKALDSFASFIPVDYTAEFEAVPDPTERIQ